MSRNPFNLWAPTTLEPLVPSDMLSMGLDPVEMADAVFEYAERIQEKEDVAFSTYAKHIQEREDVINYIVEQIQSGVGESFTIDLDDDFCESDVEYIRKEVFRRLG